MRPDSVPDPSHTPVPIRRKPVKQGMFGIFEVFTDTIVICTLTALVILCSRRAGRLWRGGRCRAHNPGLHGGIRQLGIRLYGGGDVLLCFFYNDRMGTVRCALHRVSVLGRR